MLRGLAKLTWIEIKIFLREPMGAFGTIGVPVILYIVLARFTRLRPPIPSPTLSGSTGPNLPVIVAILIAISAVLSLVTIISIYREGGILKRLRATPLRPQTILSAHVIVKLLLTAVTLGLTFLAGRRFFPAGAHMHLFSFTCALLISTLSILSIGFLIDSIVPTARFAQPIGAFLLYPMLGVSGLFVPIAELPPTLQSVSRFIPFTYAVNLLQGAWNGDSWLAHTGDLAALALVFAVCLALSAKVFRWD
jgi:ABC-2 type transport system permease protein